MLGKDKVVDIMGIYRYFRISKPSAYKVPEDKVQDVYLSRRGKTFWGVTAAYSLYYVCRMALSVVKQPLIDEGILSASQLGVIGSAMLFTYAIGKFANGFVADYCNIRRFMGIGILVSALVNLIMGICGIFSSSMNTSIIFFAFAILWGINGWVQSMGSPPGIIALSRWFPLSIRGTYYSIFSSTPYIGKFLTFILTGVITGYVGWQWGFMFAAIAGLIAAAIIAITVTDTPESCGLPSVQALSGEAPLKTDSVPTKELQRSVLRHPGIWIIALSSAFVYITQYAISGWGVLFLQKAKDFSLQSATQIIAFSEAFGIAGTVFAGWLSDKVFGGDRIKPVAISGCLCLLALALFLFTGGGYVTNILYVSLFSLAVGVLYCIVAGLMAFDIVPRKATGAALGIVGISSYIAAGIQDIVSGCLIGDDYNFRAVAIFWTAACLISWVLPIINWRHMHDKTPKGQNNFSASTI